MLVKDRVNKENYAEKPLKKGYSCDEGNALKCREFGTDMTNNTDASSDCATDEKSPCLVEEVHYESNIPRATYKTNKMSDHYSGTSITNRCVSIKHFMKFK